MLSGYRRLVSLVAMTSGLAVGAATAVAQTRPAAPIPATPLSAKPDSVAANTAIRSWGYQLQGPNPDVLASVPYDAIVIDYSRDGRDETALTTADVARLKVKPDGKPRVVLAYMSIGEAESYRFYWKRRWSDFWLIPNVITAPAWRGNLNGDWGGNYAVRYWEPEWQAIIIGDGGYLDRLVKAGFDGVWLDKVDSSLEDVAAGRSTAKADMIAFVKSIGDKGRRLKPGFRVFPQNAEALLSDPGYRAAIDGIGKEGLLYGEDGPHKPNSPALVAERVALLRQLVAEGKPVLAVEYLDKPAEIDAARAQIVGYGFVPHFGDRLLGTMRIGDYVTASARPDVAAMTAALPAKFNTKPPRDEDGEAGRSRLILLAAAALLGFVVWMGRIVVQHRRR
jgi:cysteinyl-tRNA synthetase, unknown class